MTAAQVIVLAKEPVPGRVKTRLTSVHSPQQAARLARASLNDTLDAVRRTQVDHRLLVLDGSLCAGGFTTVPQRGGPLDERLAAAFDDAFALHPVPMLLVGMDTPQLTEVLVEKALATLLSPGVDAVLGQAEDGGWWGLGLRVPRPSLIRGIVTSREDTGHRQRCALLDAGLTVVDLPVLRDVDLPEDLVPVAALCEGSFPRVVAEVLG